MKHKNYLLYLGFALEPFGCVSTHLSTADNRDR